MPPRLEQLRDLLGAADPTDILDSVVSSCLFDAGIWPSPRTSDGVAWHRVVERRPDGVRVCGRIWQIDQSEHAFWLDVTMEHEAPTRARWSLFFDLDETGLSRRRARLALDMIEEPEQVTWRVALSGEVRDEN